MKRVTNEQLKNMTVEEREQLIQDCVAEFDSLGAQIRAITEPKLIDKIAILYIKDKKVLSSRSKGKDTYYFPGGKREGSETDMETLIREIKEEMNVDIIPSSVTYYGTFEAQAHGKAEGVIVNMTCYTADFDGEPVASNEIEELRWFGKEGAEISSPVDKLIYADLLNRGLIE